VRTKTWLWLALALATCDCDWSLHRMQEQPKCVAYGATSLLAGGACNLDPPDGVIAWHAAEPAPPPPLTLALVARGRDRFTRYCAACHGVLGDGDSDVARAMRLRAPPTLLEGDAARDSDETIERYIARGYGLMPAYGDAIAAGDRWAIVAYVRVLEARVVELDRLPPPVEREALAWLR
jgi:mono/diheme cytochrome c family protein